MNITQEHLDQYHEIILWEPRTLPPDYSCPVYQLRLKRVVQRLKDRRASTKITQCGPYQIIARRLNKFQRHLNIILQSERVA